MFVTGAKPIDFNIIIVGFTSTSANYSCLPPNSWNDILEQVRELVDKATNIVMNYTETEAKVSKILWFVRLIQLNLKGSRSNK